MERGHFSLSGHRHSLGCTQSTSKKTRQALLQARQWYRGQVTLVAGCFAALISITSMRHPLTCSASALKGYVKHLPVRADSATSFDPALYQALTSSEAFLQKCVRKGSKWPHATPETRERNSAPALCHAHV